MRGAPAIAIVGALSVAVELRRADPPTPVPPPDTTAALKEFVATCFDRLKSARPTAVNIAEAAKHFKQLAAELCDSGKSVTECRTELVQRLEEMLPNDIAKNKAIGKNGALDIISRCSNGNAGGKAKEKLTVLTHCNTGSLATAGYGTALGVIRSLQEMGRLERVYCTETRPYNQGSRLTAYELAHDKIPATLVCDSMCAIAFKERGIDAVVVGADRIVSNGDTANKIGTYQIAIAARHHGVPFYIAAPMSTVDFDLQSGDQITIEERPSRELFFVQGQRVAAEGVGCWNPAFDVTPADLITGGIVTERGVFPPANLAK